MSHEPSSSKPLTIEERIPDSSSAAPPQPASTPSPLTSWSSSSESTLDFINNVNEELTRVTKTLGKVQGAVQAAKEPLLDLSKSGQTRVDRSVPFDAIEGILDEIIEVLWDFNESLEEGLGILVRDLELGRVRSPAKKKLIPYVDVPPLRLHPRTDNDDDDED
ncbi:hypothetical protein PQX77_020850 [Marasmius sp. AFHP31]|nr:hypothetical protein PQX77_020850 [Marasmius sp. AFHP31]